MTERTDVIALTAIAPVNIAVIKYWGKRDVEFNLPTNSSISVTLSMESLRATTSVAASPNFGRDVFWLNREEQALQGTKHNVCIDILRKERRLLEDRDPSLVRCSTWGLRVVSENNFPTAAGLASSAAGFAALVFSIAKLYQLPLDNTELSKIARIGSGSSSRSLFGGYVEWNAGENITGEDSCARPIAEVEQWPAMRALILVISAGRKSVPSTGGMQRTVNTSTLFPARYHKVVPERMKEMTRAIQTRDFPAFAELTMQDSNQFHAVCLDSYPPIFYLNDTSRAVISFVHAFNEQFDQPRVAYTFDAGPNAVLYYLETDEEILFAALQPVLANFSTKLSHQPEVATSGRTCFPQIDILVEGVVDVIHSKVGGGPTVVSESLFTNDGFFNPAPVS